MCGRFTLTVTVKDLLEILPALEATEAILPRYNIAPSQPVLSVTSDAPTKLTALRWGLVPRWADDPSIGSRMINARAETLAQKPAFRGLLERRRCLVLADGFYEWKKLPGKRKQPFLMQMPDGKPFAFAGLWDEWRSPEGPMRSCTIVTTDPSPQMAAIHDRMPVIVEPSQFDRWLSPEPADASSMADLLTPWRGTLRLTPVSTLVNSPANESAECIAPEPDSEPPEPEPRQLSLL